MYFFILMELNSFFLPFKIYLRWGVFLSLASLSSETCILFSQGSFPNYFGSNVMFQIVQTPYLKKKIYAD